MEVKITNKCKHCDKEYKRRGVRERHESACNPIAMKCDKCDYSTEVKTDDANKRKQLNRHRRVAHPSKIIKCPYCEYDTVNAGDYHKHWYEVHFTHKCPTCPERFISEAKLEEHHQSRHMYRYCTNCPKGYLLERNLKNHQLKCLGGDGAINTTIND